jgi:hypothetical protein
LDFSALLEIHPFSAFLLICSCKFFGAITCPVLISPVCLTNGICLLLSQARDTEWMKKSEWMKKFHLVFFPFLICPWRW